MNRKKRISTWVLFTLVGLSVVSCGKKDAGSSPQALAPPNQILDSAAGIPPKVPPGGGPILVPPPPRALERKLLILSCKFVREFLEKKRHEKVTCLASAKVLLGCSDCSDDFLSATNSHLVIACNGKDIFAGETTHTSMNDFEYLVGSAEARVSVLLAYRRNHPGSHDFDEKAWLNIDNRKFEGRCDYEWEIERIHKQN